MSDIQLTISLWRGCERAQERPIACNELPASMVRAMSPPLFFSDKERQVGCSHESARRVQVLAGRAPGASLYQAAGRQHNAAEQVPVDNRG